MPAFIRPDLLEFAAYSTHPPIAETMPPEIIDHLDTNECAYDLPPDLKEKLAWQYQQSISANRYPDGGHHALKTAIAQYVTASASQTSEPITAQQISIGNGSDELIRSLLIMTCVGRSGAILVATPTFSMYRILAQTLGIPVVSVDRNEETFELDVPAAQTAIDSNPDPIRVVFMVSPNSPTGNGLTITELTWLRQLPQDVLVVVDEAYFEFSQQTTVADAITHPNWVVTRTFSKAFRLAAHRVGYAIAIPDIIQLLDKVRLPFNLSSFSQTATHLALAHHQELLATVKELQAERHRLMLALQELPNLKVWPSTANFLYCRPTQANPEKVFTDLRQQGTWIRKTGGGLRVTIGTPEENSRTLVRFRKILT